MGTIPGFVPDGDLVRAKIAELQPDVIALGIPPEDLEGLRQLMENPALMDDIPEIDGVEALLMSALMAHGEVQVVPSPDLQAVMESGRPVVAVDMDDSAHTDLYTQSVKIRHLIHKGRIANKLEKTPITREDPHEMVQAWDAAQAKVAPIAALEKKCEEYMAAEIKKLDGIVLAIVHTARRAGVEALL